MQRGVSTVQPEQEEEAYEDDFEEEAYDDDFDDDEGEGPRGPGGSPQAVASPRVRVRGRRFRPVLAQGDC